MVYRRMLDTRPGRPNGMKPVLRRPRPANKSLGDSLAGSPPAEKLGQGGSGEPVSWDRAEEGEHRLALAEVDVRDLLREADVPANRSPLVLLRLAVGEEQGELEGVRGRWVEIGFGFADAPAPIRKPSGGSTAPRRLGPALRPT